MKMLRAALPRLLLALLVVVPAVWLALSRGPIDPALIEATIHDLGWWAPLGHIVIFALGTVFFIPGIIFSLVGGALFGPLWGTILNLTGATLGATASFLVARYVGADWVRRKAGLRLDRLITGVETEGWRFVAFVRLVPVFPFNLSNYAFGLTRIRLLPYLIASLVCMVPGALAYTWLGYASRGAAAGDTAAIRYGMIALALLAAVAFLPRLVRAVRGAPRWIEVDGLSHRLKDDGVTVIDVRGSDEFDGPLGHIAEAKNLPVGELTNRLMEIKTLKDDPVIVVCRTDKRSTKAATLLRDEGFRDVRVLRGGMEQWNRIGLPVESKRAQA